MAKLRLMKIIKDFTSMKIIFLVIIPTIFLSLKIIDGVIWLTALGVGLGLRTVDKAIPSSNDKA